MGQAPKKFEGMKKRFEYLLRMRYGVSLLIAAALLLAVVSEVLYQRTVNTVRYGIELTDARIGSARVLQLLTDGETGQRGYLLTGDTAYLQRMDAAQAELRGNRKVFNFIAGIGPNGPQDAQRLYDLTMERFSLMSRSVMQMSIGDREGAVATVRSGEGKQIMDTLRNSFAAKFSEAAKLQEDVRTDIYSALRFNRVAVLLLSVLIAIGMYWYWRKLRQLDHERLVRQQLLEEQVKQKTTELRTLAANLQTVREDEKSHLARELHDELGGLLTAAKLTLARMRSKLSADTEMLERIEQVNLHLNGGIALKRKIIEDLRPSALSNLGLSVALPAMCADAGQSMGIAVKTNINPLQLPPDTELGIYRIVQEALTNVGKYAAATEVSVELQDTETEILLDVKDNGQGFDLGTLKPGHHGLAGMRFRVESLRGQMTLQSAPGEGVHIVVRLPR